MARGRAELWDQQAFNIAFKEVGVRCCVINETLTLTALNVNVQAEGRRRSTRGGPWNMRQRRACGLPIANATGPRCTDCSYHALLDRNVYGQQAITAQGLRARRLRLKKQGAWPDGRQAGPGE